MITINEKLYNKMPEEIKKHFIQKPNPSREEVVSLFPYTESGNLNEGHKRGDGTGNSFMGGGGTIQKNYGGDSGSAARFFYTAKASQSERNWGTEKNIHPTVKPLDLMRYLVKLVTPKGGVCLDPFLGSGTTAVACKAEKFDYIGIELIDEYAEIAKARIEAEVVMFDIFDFLEE